MVRWPMRRPLQYRVAPSHGDHILVTLDTGKRKAGLAVGSVLADRAWSCSNPRGAVLTHAELVQTRARAWEPAQMADAILRAVEHALGDRAIHPGVYFVVEDPQSYEDRPLLDKDLNNLRDVLKALDVHVKVRTGRLCIRKKPGKWKGQVSKQAHTPRILRALEDGEPRPSQHDVVDAVGLWLWATGRTGRGGTR